MKKENNWLIIILVVALAITSVILASNVKTYNITTTEANTLSASGTSELTVAPDKAEVYVKVETIEDTATEAKDRNAETTDNVIGALKRKGVKKDDIETFRFNLYRKEEWNDITRKMEFVGYQLAHVLKVTTEKLGDVGELIDVSVDAGANGVEKVSFGLTKDREKEVREEALVKASSLAKEKAEVLAASLSVRLVEITSVSESSFRYAPFEYYPRAGAVVAEMEVETSIQPQNVEVSATVNLEYKIK